MTEPSTDRLGSGMDVRAGGITDVLEVPTGGSTQKGKGEGGRQLEQIIFFNARKREDI